MTVDELYEWEAYYFFEPWGAPAEDDRWRQMYSLYYAVNTKPGSEMPMWLDRDPEETKRLRELEEAKITLEDKLEAFFSMLATPVEADEDVTETPSS
jgi:hypothetical protein